jgi:REP element-mobilizing transposase RayT
MSAKREKAMVDTANENKPEGWHSRGYLPHFDAGEVFQSITFRLADSMPQSLLESWRADLVRESVEFGDKLRLRIEAYLDSGYGACYLLNPQIANIVQNALLYLDGNRYRLSAWVVMPNHVHFLAAPRDGQSLSKIMHSIKSYTSQEANKILLRKGRFWFEDYFDRYIRNARHFENAISYVESNPVRAGLCRRAVDWPFGSARHRAERTTKASAGK